MTTVSAVMRRSYTTDMFDDLTDLEHARTFDRASGVTTLTFDGDLDGATTAAIWGRMESTSDTDQERRAALRADRGALPDDDPLRRVYNYLLGDAG